MDDPTKEACQLDALAEHIRIWREEHPGVNPYVLVYIAGQWHPLRAGIEFTEQHRNAVVIETLPWPVPGSNRGDFG